jgi:hypothetical protein
MLLAGHTVALPEIVDYELRREMLRLRNIGSVSKLDQLAGALEYLRLSTAVMHRAAEFWAIARQRGRPTAGDKALDCDMILIAQAVLRSGPNDVPTVIATTNVRHLSQFTASQLWHTIS